MTLVDDDPFNLLLYPVAAVAVVLGLYASSLHSYILFHSLVEITTIAIAFALFTLTWNARPFLTSGCLKALGIGYGLISLLDLLHALAYKGIGVFPGDGANLPTQLWIAARSLQAILLCLAPLFAKKNLNERFFFGISLAAVSACTALVYSGAFPDCFIEGSGLTPFKIISEYVISALLIAALFLFVKKRTTFTPRVFALIVVSILCTICSELAFTSYISVYGPANMAGHYLKLVSYYLIYRALVVTGFQEPFDLIFRDLKQTEHALTREKEFNRLLLESMADGMVACDADGILTTFNRTAREWHGLDPMRLPPEEWAQRYNLYRSDGVTPLPTEEIPLNRAYRGEIVTDAGMAIKAKDQSLRFIVANGSIITDENEQKMGAVVVMRDVTRLRLIEEELRTANEHLEMRVEQRTAELRKSEEKYRSLIHKVQAAIVLHDGLGSILDSNPLAQELLGLSAEQLLGKELIDPAWRFLRDDGSVLPAGEYPVSRVLASGTPIKGLILGIDRQDRELVSWLMVNAEPEFDHRGKISLVIVSFVDISERKLAEEVLRTSVESYRMAQSISHVGNWEYNLQTSEFWGSDEAKRIYGFDADRDSFTTEEVERCIPEQERVHQTLIDLIESGTPYDLEFEIHPRNGAEPRIITSIAKLLRDEQRNPLKVVGVIQDITERKRFEKALQRLNRELRAISNCNQVLMKASDEQTLLSDICRIICDEAGYRMAWVGYPQNDATQSILPVAWAGEESGYIAQARPSWGEGNEHGQGPAGRVIRSGETICVQDFVTDPLMAPWREYATQHGYHCPPPQG